MTEPPPSSSEHEPKLPRQPSFIQFPHRRAMASFENLVALANYEERLREARRVVWRDKGEPPIELDDIWECVEHAARGGLRAGTLGFAIRSAVNLLLLLMRIKKVPRLYRFALIRHALIGPDSLRFAAMLGTFVGLYKLILNSLPVLLPVPKPKSTTHARLRSKLRQEHAAQLETLPSFSSSPFHDNEDDEDLDRDIEIGVVQLPPSMPRGRRLLGEVERHARLSSTAQAHQVWVRKKTRRWYSVFAGAVAGGIAIMFEKRARRVGIAQQMFVRGLQGSYNAFSQKHGIRIPHGDVIVFSLCCAQIMYGYLLRPDTLPHSYVAWIQSASQVPKEGISMNRDLVRDGMFHISDIDGLLRRKDIAPSNLTKLAERRALAILNPPNFGTAFGPCAAVHPALDSCLSVPFDRFWSVFKWIAPIYGVLHFVPMVLFRRGRMMKDPWRMVLRAGWGTAKSSAFLGVFVMIYQTFFCWKHHVYDLLSYLRSSTFPTSTSPPPLRLLSYLAKLLPQRFLDIFISKSSFWLGGLLTGLSLFVEEKRRREELAMYVLPKGLESAWRMARGKGLVFGMGEFGEVLLSAVGMGMVMSIYQNDPHHLSGLVRRILYQFIGPN